MTRFKRDGLVVEAYQWEKNGDHPKDGPKDKEGRVRKTAATDAATIVIGQWSRMAG